MKSYYRINNIVGWAVFAVAAAVYLMTIEPTASFWDCGEFITSAYKLEVGHPPGAPFFMLVGNLFTQLTSDPAKAAMMVNSMSAIFSALTILFLFWSITHIAKKILEKKEGGLSLAETIVTMGAGAVGALAYTFSDTFWFSAVEGEVYAFSSLFTALVFWLILKWESKADQPSADRWLVLIAYFMGLSIGVHLLNLLCIPAIVLVYYFKKFTEPSLKGTLTALLVSFAIVGLMLYGFVQGLVEVCGWFELLCVNTLSLPYNSGVIVYLIVVTATLFWGLYESSRKEIRPLLIRISFLLSVVLLGIPFIGDGIWLGIVLTIALGFFLFYWKKAINVRLFNTALAVMFVILVGYSSYATILIRSSANPPMDQNAPEDIFTIATYLNREQYGERPLLYGNTYASEVAREATSEGMCAPQYEKGAPIWRKKIKDASTEKDRYVIDGHKTDLVYASEFNMLFPRMYSSTPSHVQAYKEWAQIEGRPQRFNRCGEETIITKPTFIENIRFFISYQVNYMYWRYFMWNFSGRQNDLQGSGEINRGNWITGIPFIDGLWVGPQKDMPTNIIDNRGHNVYYLLPLLLGLIGLFYQLYAGKKGVQSFWVTFLLFFMTGLAIVIYLNQTPLQPRERDYAYAGSFYAFCIWIGFGVVGLWRILVYNLKEKHQTVIAAGVSALCLLVPIQMAGQNWDDHDRSERYVCRDFGMNYLSSCAPNAIIFTYGDNDTFPLWYAQEVEGFRTDVRVCNLSYLQTDWYIDQMKRKAYDSDPLPISWTKAQYLRGVKDFAYIVNRTKAPILLSDALNFVRSDDPRSKLQGVENGDYIPSDHLVLPVNKQEMLDKGVVRPADSSKIVSQIDFRFDAEKKAGLYKHELMILDMLQNNDWNRPIYYAISVSEDQYLNLGNYFQLTGMAQRITPINTAESGNVMDTEAMYDNMMNKFRWGNVAAPKVYLDENVLRMCQTSRYMFTRLAMALAQEGKTDKALAALDRCMEVLPASQVPLNSMSGLDIGEQYYLLGQQEKAREIFRLMGDDLLRNLNWFFRLRASQLNSVSNEMQQNLAVLQQVVLISAEHDPDFSKEYESSFNEMVQKWRASRL